MSVMRPHLTLDCFVSGSSPPTKCVQCRIPCKGSPTRRMKCRASGLELGISESGRALDRRVRTLAHVKSQVALTTVQFIQGPDETQLPPSAALAFGARP